MPTERDYPAEMAKIWSDVSPLELENKRLREALSRIATRINDMPIRTRNDYEEGEKAAYEWCADNALAALES